CCDSRRHEYRTQARKGSFDYSSANITTFFAQLIEIADHHHSVEHGDSAQRDETYGRGNAKWHIAQPKGKNAPCHSQRDTGIHEQRLAYAAEGHEDQDKDEYKRRGHNNRQSRLGFAKIFELPTKFERVAFRQFDVLPNFCLSLSHPAFHVAVSQVHHQRRAALS